MKFADSRMNTCNVISGKIIRIKYVYVIDLSFSGDQVQRQIYVCNCLERNKLPEEPHHLHQSLHVPLPSKNNASPGTQPEAPGRSLGFGHHQHPKPDNRDSQHMLKQHRGSFLDTCCKPFLWHAKVFA